MKTTLPSTKILESVMAAGFLVTTQNVSFATNPADFQDETSSYGSEAPQFKNIGETKQNWREIAESQNKSKNLFLIEYEKKSFCFGKDVFLNFDKPFQLSFKGGYVTLHPSEISFLCPNILEFDSSLLRIVEYLMSKARSRELSPEEGKMWLAFLDLFDYQQFSLDLAPAMYEELEISGINENGKYATLFREDGKKDKVSFVDMPSLGNGRFKKGEHIGAMVKRNCFGNIVAIYDEVAVNNAPVDETLWDKIKVI